jgi:hypothetical protein
MAKPKLTNEQRETLLTWLAADYDSRLITLWFKERDWPELSRDTLSYYRTKHGIDIEKMRAERKESALNTGLALKEERVKRLTEHADTLEAIKWIPDPKTGKLHNEKAWRETVADIAAETGGRKQNIDVTSGGEKITPKVDDERFDRAVSTFADALGEILSGKGTKSDSDMDTPK